MTVLDKEIRELIEETSPENTDIFVIQVDLASTPTTKKITLANLDLSLMDNSNANFITSPVIRDVTRYSFFMGG